MADVPGRQKRVLASGVFDVVHPGHLHYLKSARALGDRLAVVVTSDNHAALTKRRPMHSEAERRQLVASLQPVDEVIVGADPYDLTATVRMADPDVIALGFDQSFDEQRLASELEEAGMHVEVRRVGKYPGRAVATRHYRAA